MSGLVKDEIEMPENEEARGAVGDYKAGWHDPENSTIRFDFGLSEEVVREISKLKEEPEWMTEIRVRAFEHFSSRPMPTWGNTSRQRVPGRIWTHGIIQQTIVQCGMAWCDTPAPPPAI